MARIIIAALLIWGVSVSAVAQLQATPVPLPPDVQVSFGGLAPQSVPPDYSNITTSTGYYFPRPANTIVADDVHRVTSLPIKEVSFAYYSPDGAPDVVMYIYGNTPADVLPAPLLANYSLGTLNQGVWAYTITLPTPLSAPADLWIGFSFSLGNAGLLIYNPPTVGTSHNLFAINNAGPYWFGGTPVANFYLQTVPVPEPASLLVLGSGVMGLLALRRRRA